MNTASVSPELLRWAQELAELSGVRNLAKKFPRLDDWKDGKSSPTFKELEKFADATYMPLGYFFLSEPPDLSLPIKDFRRKSNHQQKQTSLNLLDTIYTMQYRQAWLREERLALEIDPLEFVGSAELSDDPSEIGKKMRRVVGLEGKWAEKMSTRGEASNTLRQAIEDLGIIAIINGVVGNNNSRKLSVDEFQGFALCDDLAPLIFVNGSDFKSAQMFTLAHELAHIWLGKKGAGLSKLYKMLPDDGQIEQFCDKIAAEFLVPKRELLDLWIENEHKESHFKELAQKFKISPIVVARRSLDLELIKKKEFFDFYNKYKNLEWKQRKNVKGGSFYNSQNTKVGKQFAIQVICAAKEGRISFKEAYDLTDLYGKTFQGYAEFIGINLP